MYRITWLCCLIMIVNFTIDAQKKKYLSPELNYASDIISNFSGGDKRDTQVMGIIKAGLSVDTDSAGLWKGGTFDIELMSTYGKGMSATNLHDLQGISAIEAGNHPLLFWELWYHQQFGKFGIRAGLQNINSDFMIQSYTNNFSSGSYNAFPTLSLNYSLANYPVAGLGISFSYRINNQWTVLSSIFNGKVSDLKTDRFNSHWRLNPKKDGLLSLSELKYSSDASARLSPTYAFGAVFHNKPFSPKQNPTKSYNYNYTFYTYGEHDFYKTSTKSAGIFLQGSYAPKNRNLAYGYTSIGFVMSGFFTSKHIDNVGIGLAQLYYQELDNTILKNSLENNIEMYFMIQLNKYISVKPSFISIISPPKSIITAGLLHFYVDIF